MAVTSATLRKLASLNLDADQMAGVLEVLADQQEAEESRLLAQRERKARQRAGQSRGSHGTVTARERDMVADPLPSKEGPHTPKETQPTLPTTHKEKTPKGVQKKASRLPADWTLPDGWGRDAIEAGLPANLIDLEAAKMRDWSMSAPMSKGACTDWRARWRNWCRQAVAMMPQARASPQRPMTAQQILKARREEIASDDDRLPNRPVLIASR